MGILALLWLHAAAVPVYALIRGYSFGHAALESVILSVAALLATWSRLPRRFRTAVASLGLLSASSVLVHFSGGLIEVHFHFFVMVAVVALYQDWIPFLSSVAYVLVHHSVMGVIDPDSVFNHPAALNNPMLWAAIHALFVAGISIVCLVTWRLNERILDERRVAEERLLEETRVVQTLHDVGLSLATELDARTVMQTVTDASRELTGAAFGVFVYDTSDDSGRALRLCTASGAPIAAVEQFLARRAGSVCDPSLAGQETVRLGDVQEDRRYARHGSQNGGDGQLFVRSYLAVPVRFRSGQVHGQLFFGHPDRGRFHAVHERLAAGIAAHAAVALDNARLYDEQRNTALTLQHSLLPQTVPQIAGVRIAFAYSPASSHAEIGGDWYDVLPLADGSVALTVGDVVGHDLRAAAVMGQLRNVMRIAALEAESPARALARVDRYMGAAGLSDLTTVAHARFDADTATLTYALAGHPPPLLIHADGHGKFLHGEPMPPLGAGFCGDVGGHDRAVRLTPGDAVVLYTDGLVERRGTSLEDRLSELAAVGCAASTLPPDQLCKALLRTLTSGSEQSDDIALLVLTVDAIAASAEAPGVAAAIHLGRRAEADGERSSEPREPAALLA